MAQSNPAGLTSRRPFTLLGILLALLVIAAFVLVAINAGNGQAPATDTVVITTRDLAPRVAIDVSALDLKALPVAGYPVGIFFHNINDVKGMIPLVTILSGQPITSNVIAKPGATLGSQSEFLPIPSGFVALTLPTSEEQGVGGYIQPDDYISVIATVSLSGKVATKTVFTNLHVIRVGPLSAASAGQAGTTTTASSLTVVVTECQAEFITWFLTYASLKYSLESYHDYLPSTKDPSCPSVEAAKGVTLQLVMATWPSLF